MKHASLSVTFIFLVVVASCAIASAQRAAPVPQSESTSRTTADETFELNITERHITQRGFSSSTMVEAGDEAARGLLLRVGVAVGADEIDVLLRNVRGRVRFRATLERVLARINSRRAPGTAP